MERVRRGTTKSATTCESKREPPEKLYDEDAGMYYFNARWYDSEIGRFVTQDPARDGVNWYAYCSNNPLTYTDPDGLEESQVFITAGHKKNLLQKFDDELTRFCYRNFVLGGSYGADGLGNKLISTMDGRKITVSRSGEKYFSNSEKDFDRMFFLVNLMSAELGLLSKTYAVSSSMQSAVSEYARVDNISNIEKYGHNLGKDGQLFLTDSKTIKGLDLTTKAGLENAEHVLGLPKGQLSNSRINVVTTVNTTDLNVRLPTSGNEFFIPGGRTSGGAPEIVVDPMNIFTDASVSSIQFIQQLE